MLFKRLTAALCSATMLIGISLSVSTVSAESTSMRDITTMELVRDMGVGINLGNTFESCGDWIAQWGDGSVKSYETAWGSPVITKQMIEGYANEGFGVLRVPVAWSNLMGNDYTISADYIARVKEVVNWAIDSNMYVILNIHYDNGWFANFSTDKDTCMYKYTRIWTQLTDTFQDYSDYLMFESLNEEGCWSDIWNRYSGSTTNKDTAYNLLYDINQKFVDIVRSSGGNNPKRHLLIAGYATDITLTCDSYFKMPNDPMNRCAVSVHYYTPAGFAILEEDADWGKASSTWGTDAEVKELQTNMDLMKTNFIDKGIPVIIGEYGCPTKNKDADSVRFFLSSVCGEAYSRQLCPVLWDITGLHYDRTTYKLNDSLLKTEFQNIVATNEHLNGDINNDGSLTIADLVLLKKYILNCPIDTELLGETDINVDNKTNSLDISALLTILLQIA